MQRVDAEVSALLPMGAILTIAQFPGVHLAPAGQADAMDALSEYFDEVAESEVEGGTMISFPGVESSSIPGDGMDVGVKTELERVENYRRFGAAAAASVVQPEYDWPEPFSRDLPADAHAAEVWASLERLAVIALAAMDGHRIRVDVDPTEATLGERCENCVDPSLLGPASTLAPSIPGDHDDMSWALTQATQTFAYGRLLEALLDPRVTAPVSQVVASLGPRCPWGNKRGYGFGMIATWYETRRLERLAAVALESEDRP